MTEDSKKPNARISVGTVEGPYITVEAETPEQTIQLFNQVRERVMFKSASGRERII